MTDPEHIPLLVDLIKRGESIEPQVEHDLNPANDVDIEIDAEIEPELHPLPSEALDDEEQTFSNVRELLLEEEIRLILDNHMEQAYEEISALLRKRQL